MLVGNNISVNNIPQAAFFSNLSSLSFLDYVTLHRPSKRDSTQLEYLDIINIYILGNIFGTVHQYGNTKW